MDKEIRLQQVQQEINRDKEIRLQQEINMDKEIHQQELLLKEILPQKLIHIKDNHHRQGLLNLLNSNIFNLMELQMVFFFFY